MKKTVLTRSLSALLAVLLAFTLLTPALADTDSYWFLPTDIDYSKVSFQDVPADYWGHDAIEIFAQCGYINGYPDGTFMPDKPVDYAEFYTMLVRAQLMDGSGQYLTGGNPWWKPFLDVARECGFTKGTLLENAYVNGQWDVNKVGTPMTRYEMAQAISSYIDAMTETLGEGLGDAQYHSVNIAGQYDLFQYEDSFSIGYNVDIHGPDFMPKTIADEASIPANYLHAVQQNYKERILTGVDAQGTFNGNSGITRAQAAAALVRLLFHSNGKLTPDEQKTWDAYYGSGYEIAHSTTAPATGYLTNGKPITEENIVELLKELEKAYPDGLEWNNDNKYSYDSPMLDAAGYTAGSLGGCGGFAFMLTDQIFGNDPNVNPVRIHQNLDELKPGDIIVHVKNDGDWDIWDMNHVTHVGVALGIGVVFSGKPYAMKYLLTADGNTGGSFDQTIPGHGCVSWDWGERGYCAFDQQIDDNDYIITRW